ncbi:dipeptidyl peptidase III [Hypoxylon sp. FL1284]|nr:dipeptidyl peptidase III [Hypoxylon sp. FL1284]
MAAPVQIYKLGIAQLFAGLSEQEKRYSHYMSRAAWSGTRIILRQVSPESIAIFDFILELHRLCGGDWKQLSRDGGIDEEEMQAWLEYAATFLSNIGNYYGSGDQKFVPRTKPTTLQRLSSLSPKLSNLYEGIQSSLVTIPPFTLGYPSAVAQSAYYEGGLEKDEIALVNKYSAFHSIFPENTRLRKTAKGTYEVLQASALTEEAALSLKIPSSSTAAEHAANDTQKKFLAEYIKSFRTGSLDAYRDSQRTWVTDKAPSIENIFGLVEPYRDPAGTRSEFEGLVAIADAEETKLLSKLVESSDTFIRRLPWASAENNGKGLFEKSLFEPPDFSSIHTLAYCSSIIFPGINLPNYNDIRQDLGFKNVIIANRMVAESAAVQWPFIDDSEIETFQKHKYPAYYWWVVLHELLGHGTGKMMVEEPAGKFNFDPASPPLSPLDGEPIKTWYKPSQTWTGQFEDLATTVDECRAELVGAYLMDDTELLALFGYTDESEIRASDLTYNLYQQLGVDGLRALSNFNVDGMKWGQAHSRAHFAMLKCLLRHGGGCVRVYHSKEAKKIIVNVDRSKIISHGKKALGEMLLRLHMYRCTADVQACREYYEDLSYVDAECLEWRQIVIDNKPPPLLNVQANTFIDGEAVTLREYEPTVEGIIQSWAERAV